MNAQQRKNLLKLAAYLESLPENYAHFDMENYAAHLGVCDLPSPADRLAATKPQEFLANCGTVACAIGHGPAAGIPLFPEEMTHSNIRWYQYADRAFAGDEEDVFDSLFSGDWGPVDNHHYGAAARIRYLLEQGPLTDEDTYAEKAMVRKYAPYRKGSRSAQRHEIEAARGEQGQ